MPAADMPIDVPRNPRSQRQQAEDLASRVGQTDFTQSLVCPEESN